eukprot:COSAG04_NODE_277_length_18399_cov_3.036066_5_plen_305_part_00
MLTEPATRTFSGSRSAWVSATFDYLGSSPGELGSPDMNPWPGKYGMSSATFKDQLNFTDQREGLWGGHLPIITFQHTISGPPSGGGGTCGHCTGHCKAGQEPAGGCKYPCQTGSAGQCCVPCHAPPRNATCTAPCKRCQHHPTRCCCPGPDGAELQAEGEPDWIEFVAVPVADMEGSPEQDVFFRISKIHANGTVIDSRYFDTYSFTGTAGPDLPADVNWGETVTGMGSPAHSEVAIDFYRHVLIQKQWWEAEFAFEGVMEFELPRAPGTDGLLLRDQALHVLIKDMIIRQAKWFPQYGLLPLW